MVHAFDPSIQMLEAGKSLSVESLSHLVSSKSARGYIVRPSLKKQN